MNKEARLPSNSKPELRLKYLQIAEALNSSLRSAAGKKLLAALIPLIPEEGAILSFAPLESEIDLWPLNRELCAQRRLVLPRLENGELVLYRPRDLSQLRVSRLGIREPDPMDAEHFPTTAIKLALIPAVAFDAESRRLGRGKGHYDRLLPLLPRETLKIGIGFTEQLSKEPLPEETHDIKMDRLLLF